MTSVDLKKVQAEVQFNMNFALFAYLRPRDSFS